MIIGTILTFMVIMPFLFHDFILTVERTSYPVQNDPYFSQILPGNKVIRDLGIEDFFTEADANYDNNLKTGRECADFSLPYYRNFCESSSEIKAYKATQILLRFTFNHQTPEFHSAVMGDADGKTYVVYLQSINWKEYLISGSIISIVSVLISVWVFIRHEKRLTRLQNHLIGSTLATLVGIIVILAFLRIGVEPLIIFPPSMILFVGPFFVAAYAAWYFIYGERKQNYIERKSAM